MSTEIRHRTRTYAPPARRENHLRAFLVVLVLLSVTSFVGAKEREWQDATVTAFRSGDAGSATFPVGTASVTVPINQTAYWIKAGNTTYVISCYPRARANGWRCPNLTVNGHTKIAIEGRNAHILDDDGKDRKVPIIAKIADPTK
jgi:hypothetical protein